MKSREDIKKQVVTIFNNQLKEFMTESKRTFPDLSDDPNVKKLINSLDTTMTLTPHVPLVLFYENVVKKYKKELDDKNDDFFLKHDGLDENDAIGLFKKVYKMTNSENKDIIWSYVNRLKILSIKYYE